MKLKILSLLLLFSLSQKTKAQNKIESFEIYGIHNPTLKDSTRIMLSHTTDEHTFIHIGTLNPSKPKLQRIHHNIQCQAYPEVFSTTQKCDTLSFTDLPYSNTDEKNYKHKIYTFYNTEKYNDIIVYYHPKEKIEELKKRYNVTTSSNTQLNTIKYNQYYVDEDEKELFNLTYRLDENRNAYIDKLNYVEGEENNPDYDYNNDNLLFIYKIITDFKIIKSEITINNNSIFKNHCQD